MKFRMVINHCYMICSSCPRVLHTVCKKVWLWQPSSYNEHDDVIKWKHFPRNWPFVRRIHRSPVNSPHKGQWRGALMFSLICVWINDWVNNREAGDLRRYRDHYDVIVMVWWWVANMSSKYLDHRPQVTTLKPKKSDANVVVSSGHRR